jgi:hypothetical protein
LGERLETIKRALEDKRSKREAIKNEFKDKEKEKALTIEQRLDRIERLMGV